MKKRHSIYFLITLTFLTALSAVIYNYYNVLFHLERADCNTDLSKTDIDEFLKNYEEYVRLARMADFTYARHGLEYKAHEENCTLDDSFTENSCKFSYITSISNGEFKYDLDSKLGYNINIYEENGIERIDIAFKGTDSLVDWKINKQQSFGEEIPQHEKALSIVYKKQNEYPNHKITLTGHSLGGGIATYAGLITGLKTVSFNPARLSKVTTEKIQSLIASNLDNRGQITHIRMKGDIVSSQWSTSKSIIFGKQFIFPFNFSPISSHSILTVIERLEDFKNRNTSSVCSLYYGYESGKSS